MNVSFVYFLAWLPSLILADDLWKADFQAYESLIAVEFFLLDLIKSIFCQKAKLQ